MLLTVALAGSFALAAVDSGFFAAAAEAEDNLLLAAVDVAGALAEAVGCLTAAENIYIFKYYMF